MTQNGDYDVIVLTETWLNNETNSTQLFGSEYTKIVIQTFPENYEEAEF